MSLTADEITANNFKAFYNQIRPYLNGSAHSGFTPIGTVISVMGTTAPLNYLECDGTVYNIADYSELAAYFNQQFGASNHFGGNGTTTFAVPDLRGEFLRGTGTNSHADQGSGAAVGVHQDGTRFPNIFSDENTVSALMPPNEQIVPATMTPDNRIAQSSVNRVRLSTREVLSQQDKYVSLTSRPTNTSVLFCIASKNIFMDAGSNYSTEEQVVGTWIDGKPLYQKTVEVISDSINHDQVISFDFLGLIDVDKVVDYDVMFVNVKLNYFAGSGDFFNVFLNLDTNSVTLAHYGTWTHNKSCIITFKYTKTTD